VDSLDFDALEDTARAKMSPGACAFCAQVPTTRSPWRRLRLRPRVLRDISHIDTTTTLLGTSVPTPLLVAPSGRHKIICSPIMRPSRGAATAGA
jgi:4-hydroxymandelate oxidase